MTDTEIPRAQPSQRSPFRTLLSRLYARCAQVDGSVWLVWIVLLIHYRATRGIFQGKGSGDGFLGFMYLPGLVLHHSFDLAKPAAEWIGPLGREITGLVANPCPVGPVLFWLPFYLLGLLFHKLAALPGVGFLLTLLVPTLDGKQPITGRTEADLYMAGIGSLLAGMWGIWTLFQLIERHSGRQAARFSVVGSVLASPLCWYLTTQPLYQHATAFFAVTQLIDAWDRYRNQLSFRRCMILGSWAGLAILQRPQEAIWLLPIGVSVCGLIGAAIDSHWQRNQSALRQLWIGIGYGVTVLATATLWFVPQVLLWIHYYGSVRAPQKPGHFLWSSPALVESLFSMRTGIFPWVPAMYLAMVGIVLLLRRSRALMAPILITAMIELYVNASAWDFHGSWSFGPRRYTDAIVVLALGLGALYQHFGQKPQHRRYRRMLWGLLILLCVQNAILVEWVRTRRTKSSSGGAYSAATWIRWAKGPQWLARTLERTGYPFLQPVSALYALRYQIPVSSVENLLGNFVNERDWRIREFVLTPQIVVAERPPQIVQGILPMGTPPAQGNVDRHVRVLIPLVLSEPLRLRLEGQLPGPHSALIVRWNGQRLLPEASSDLSFLIPQALVKGRPRWNELTIDDIAQGAQLQRILVQSTSRWWK